MQLLAALLLSDWQINNQLLRATDLSSPLQQLQHLSKQISKAVLQFSSNILVNQGKSRGRSQLCAHWIPQPPDVPQHATMRVSTDTLFPTALVLIYFLRAISAQATSALTLTTFQPINGFSVACTKAYNTPLTDCSNSDFSGQGCSAKCIGFLDSLTNLLTSTCVGTSASPNTLIGLFFIGKGAETLCSNSGGTSSSSGDGNGYAQGGGQTGAPIVQSVVIVASTLSTSTASTSSTIPSITLAAATSSTTTTVPNSVTPEPTTTSIAVVGITVTPQSPSDASTSVVVVGTTVTPESPSDASTSSSNTKSSTSSSSTSTTTSNGNGGGTPLDIESWACRDAAVSLWLFALITGSAGVIWLL